MLKDELNKINTNWKDLILNFGKDHLELISKQLTEEKNLLLMQELHLLQAEQTEQVKHNI